MLPAIDSLLRTPDSGHRRARFWLTVALAVATIPLALALACDNFQTRMDSDLVWTQVFAHDLGDPLHPVSGWMFGSATFWFPDFALFLPLKWLCGESGLNYPLYLVTIFLLTGATLSWSLAAAGVELGKATMAGFLTVDGVLLCQFLPGHSDWLWLYGLPGYHGGSVPLGLALLALTLAAARAGRWTRGRALATAVLMSLGLASDTLLLVHWVGPLFLALWWQTWRTPGLRRVLGPFVAATAGAFAFAVVLRYAFLTKQWFFFSGLLQYSPTPANIWKSFSHFAESFLVDGVLANNWALWLLAGAGFVAAWRSLRVAPPAEGGAVKRLALVFGLVSLLAAWATPIATVYWVNPHSIRYLPNWLVLPAWMLVLRYEGRPFFSRWVPKLAAVGAAAGIAFSAPRLSVDKLFFPPPPEELRAFCARHNFTQGLGDYWHGHLLTVEWRFTGPRLGEIADDFFPVFWCNNAFDYFPQRENGRSLETPKPQFIILDGLNTTHVLHWLQSNTLQIAHVGPYHIAVLTPEQSATAGARITTQAKELLDGERARWLQQQFDTQ